MMLPEAELMEFSILKVLVPSPTRESIPMLKFARVSPAPPIVIACLVWPSLISETVPAVDTFTAKA